MLSSKSLKLSIDLIWAGVSIQNSAKRPIFKPSVPIREAGWILIGYQSCLHNTQGEKSNLKTFS